MVGFIVLISSLCKKDWFIRRGIHESNIDSNKVQEYIKDGQEHPAIEFYYCFSCREPDAAITYEWSLTFEEILSFLNPRQLIRCSMKYKKMIPFHLDRLYIWIDVFFVNQLSENIAAALELSDKKYMKSRFHLALGTETLLTRCWCLSEYAVRFGASKRTLVLESYFSSQRFDLNSYLKRASGRFYEEMQAKFEADKTKIREKIDMRFYSPDFFNSVIKGIVYKATEQLEAHAALPSTSMGQSHREEQVIYFLSQYNSREYIYRSIMHSQPAEVSSVSPHP